MHIIFIWIEAQSDFIVDIVKSITCVVCIPFLRFLFEDVPKERRRLVQVLWNIRRVLVGGGSGGQVGLFVVLLLLATEHFHHYLEETK